LRTSDAVSHGITPSTTEASDATPCSLRRRNIANDGTSWQTPLRAAPRRGSNESSPDSSSSSDKENSPAQKPFTAMTPVNVLISLEMLTTTFEKTFLCPSRSRHKCKPSLEVECLQFGLATEIYISCKHCSFSTALLPLKQDKVRGGIAETSPRKRESNRFHNYSINCLAALLQQKLGMGLRGLEMIMAFIGLAPSYGSDDKWSKMFNALGTAEELICDQVMLNNIQEEIRLTKEAANVECAKWLTTTDQSTTEDDKTAKLNSLLMLEGDKVGITIGADGAWQKRAIGRSSHNSTTGHNFGVGGLSNRIVSLQVFSKHCRICEEAAKRDVVEPRSHRCPKNFDEGRSAKSMEAQGAVQHCVEIATGPSGAHVAAVVTDDDSTTRSNLKHSLEDVFNQRYGVGNWTSRTKRQQGWPVGPDNKLVKDTGKLPLNVPPPKHLHSDMSHRIRGVGYAAFDCKSEAKIKNDKGLMKVECLNLKRNMGYYVKSNQHLSDEDFNRCGMCVVQHLFNDHSLCDIKWCANLKAQQEQDEAKRKQIDNPNKHRKIVTVAEKKLCKKVKEKVGSLLVPAKMQQVHHRFSTQKNESLNRNATAVAPKDRFYGGTMQLHDRLRVIAMTDSIGEHDTLFRLFSELGFDLHPVLCRWARNKDRDDAARHLQRMKPEVKKKRAIGIIEKIKSGMKQERKATTEGMTYATGIANTEGDPIIVNEEDADGVDGFDEFD